MKSGQITWEGSPDRAMFYAGCNLDCLPMSAPHRHSELEMGYVARGAVRIGYASEEKELPAGSLNIFWAILPHQLLRVDPPLRSYVTQIPLPWLLTSSFHSAWCESLITDLTVLHLSIPPADRPWVEGYFLRWIDDYQRLCTFRDCSSRDHLFQMLRCDFQAFLLRLWILSGEADSSQLSDAAPWLVTILQMIHSGLETELSVIALARRAGLNQQYLSREFKRKVGVGLSQYVTQERLRLAKYLLNSSNRKVADVAFACGFGNLGNFNELFKSNVGLTPREYRAKTERRAD